MTMACPELERSISQGLPHQHPRRVGLAPSGLPDALSTKHCSHRSIKRAYGPLYEIGITIDTTITSDDIDARSTEGR